MKKIVLGLFVLLSCFVLLFIGVKTKAVSAPVMTTGASIRATGERQGLKFTATVDSLDGVTEHGFYVALGTHTQSEMATAINSDATGVGGKKLKKVEVTGEDTTFHAVIYNIPEAKYGQVITAIAYVSDGSTKTLSSEVMTRNIADIARGLYNTSSTYDEDNNQVYTVANACKIKLTRSGTAYYYDEFSDFSFAEGDTIELIKGTYTEALTINANNVNIRGVNSGVHYDGARNTNESIITGNLTISANTHYLTLDGLKFSGTSKIVNTAGTAGAADAATSNTDNFTFKNNIVETNLASGNGFIYFTEAGSSYSNDLTFEYNLFKCVNGSSTLTALVYIDNNRNLNVENNKFQDVPNKAFYVNDTTKGAAGNVTVTNNIFTSVGTDAFGVNWFSPYPNGNTTKEILVTNNTFDSVTGKCISFVKANTTDRYATFEISNNTFTNIGTGFYSARINSTYGIEMNNNVFNTRPTTAYAQVDALNDAVKLNARYNLFKESSVVVLPNADKYSSTKIDIFAPTTGDPADLIIKAGDTRQLNSSNLGLNMTGTIEFASCSSDDEGVATINGTGLITAVAAGETDLHATVLSYNNIPLTIHVEVVNGIVGATAVLVGRTSTYTYAGSGTIEWSTSNDSIATIDGDGELTALSYGEIEVILTVNAVEMDRVDVLVTPNEFYVDDNWSSYSNGEQITYNTKKYVKGLNAFHTISSSLAANRTIYVLAGTYSDEVTISYNDVTILGPNSGILGNGSRVTEANISNTITVDGDNITIKGIKLSGTGKCITWTKDISNLVIQNVVSTASGLYTSSGRTAIIVSEFAANGLTIKGLSLTCTGAAGRNGVAIYGIVTNLDVEDCYFTNGVSSYTNSEVIRIPKVAGTVKVEHNNFDWSTKNMSLYLGGTSNTCSSMTLCNNIITGGSTNKATTVGYCKLPSSCSVEIIGNKFDHFDSGDTFWFTSSASGSSVLIAYNYFANDLSFKTTESNLGNAGITFTNNYYESPQTTSTTDSASIPNKAGLISAYEGSDKYETYGSVCIYKD